MKTTTILSENTKQPGGFYVLFLTELWERFGFYLMNALLVLYMTKALGYSDAAAYTSFAGFSALLYITPIMGGYVADHFLGYRLTLTLGSVLLTFGYALLLIPETWGVFLALSFVVVGMGCFKSMPYALLNQLYRTSEQRRKIDSAFTLYYLAIQIGSIPPVLVGGFLVHALGWHPTFAIAAIGMFIGLLTFILNLKFFKDADIEIGYRKRNNVTFSVIVVGCFIAAGIMNFLLNHSDWAHLIVWTITVVMLGYIAIKARALNAKERIRLLIALALTAFGGVVFFALYYQQPMSLTLFVDRNVNRHFLGLNIPSASYWALNPIFVLSIGAVLSVVYDKLSKIGKDPSITMKFGFGVIFMALGYFIVVWGTYFADSTYHISSWWIVGSYALQATAELLVNALGTAMIAKLVPKSLVSVMMGMWFIGTAIGGLLSGTLAKLAAIPKTEMDPLTTLHVYAHAFNTFAWLSLVVGIIACIAAPTVTRLVKE
jgi:POT family proton-dependent oligopeptide transporter